MALMRIILILTMAESVTALLIILIQVRIPEVLRHMDLMDQQQRNSRTIHTQEPLQEAHRFLRPMAPAKRPRPIILIQAPRLRAIRLQTRADNMDLRLTIMVTVQLLKPPIPPITMDRQPRLHKIPMVQKQSVPAVRTEVVQ